MEEDIEEFKRLFYSDRLTSYGKRKLIEYYEQRIKELEIKLDDKETELQILKDDIKADEIMYKDELSEECIPVSLVEEKIEEVNKEDDNLMYKNNIIQVLQELLEKRK